MPRRIHGLKLQGKTWAVVDHPGKIRCDIEIFIVCSKTDRETISINHTVPETEK